MNAVRILGAVTIAGGSIALLAETFKGFATTVGESQADLLDKVNATSKQGFKETIANLQATNEGIRNMNPLENVLAGIFGGSEITKNFEDAAGRIVAEFKTGTLTRGEMLQALAALKETRDTNPEVELPGVESAIKLLTAELKNPRAGTDPKGKANTASAATTGAAAALALLRRKGFLQAAGTVPLKTPPPVPARRAGPTVADFKALQAKQQATKNAIENAKSISSRENSAQKSEIARTKQAAATAGRTTTSAVNTNAAATRGVAPPITAAVYAIGASLAATIWAARPVIQSTNVVNNYTRTQRTGSTSGSRDSSRGYSGNEHHRRRLGRLHRWPGHL